MVLSSASGSTKGKVEIRKMRRLRRQVDTHFSDTTLAKRTCVMQDDELCTELINESPKARS